MNDILAPPDDLLKQTIDKFWETFPSFWHEVGAHIRQAAAEKFAVSVEQFHILRHIRKGYHSVSELADVKHISRPAVSQAVETLVQRGMVERTQSTSDRRYMRLELTPEGAALLDAVFGDTRQWMAEKLAVLNREELQDLGCALDALKKTLSL